MAEIIGTGAKIDAMLDKLEELQTELEKEQRYMEENASKAIVQANIFIQKRNRIKELKALIADLESEINAT